MSRFTVYTNLGDFRDIVARDEADAAERVQYITHFRAKIDAVKRQ